MTQRQVKKQIQDRQKGRTDSDLLWIMIYMSAAMIAIKGERVTLVVQLVGRTERFLTAYRSN